VTSRIHRLTRRETEISQWMLLGFTSKEISRILPASPRTVETHINNIKLKLGSKNRVHMATQLILRDMVLLTVEDLETFD
jgi:DNA-binding CsgD family transcriptional regulator